MRLRPQPQLDLLRQPSGKLGSSCMKRTFRKSRKSVPQILSLEEGEEATQEDFDSSPDFRLRWLVDKTRPPTVIGEHWIDHLDSEGRIAKCKPHNFKFEDEWLPLYTRAGVTKKVSLLNTQGDSPLIAIIPLDMSFQYEREYVIHQLHEATAPASCPQRIDCSLGFRGSSGVETPGLFLLWRPLVSFLSFETFGLCFMSFDFWRLSLHTLM